MVTDKGKWKYTNMIRNRTEVDRYIRLKIENTDFNQYKEKMSKQISIISQRTHKMEKDRQKKHKLIKKLRVENLNSKMFSSGPSRKVSPDLSETYLSAGNPYYKDSIIEKVETGNSPSHKSHNSKNVLSVPPSALLRGVNIGQEEGKKPISSGKLKYHIRAASTPSQLAKLPKIKNSHSVHLPQAPIKNKLTMKSARLQHKVPTRTADGKSAMTDIAGQTKENTEISKLKIGGYNKSIDLFQLKSWRNSTTRGNASARKVRAISNRSLLALINNISNQKFSKLHLANQGKTENSIINKNSAPSKRPSYHNSVYKIFTSR